MPSDMQIVLLLLLRYDYITYLQWMNMLTSSNGNISALLAICAGNYAQRPVTRNFDVFFDLRPNKWLSKQW